MKAERTGLYALLLLGIRYHVEPGPLRLTSSTSLRWRRHTTAESPTTGDGDIASDLDNLTIADPRVNRTQKGARDAAEWRPTRHGAWFA